ncbi:MAG TPA: NUDIX hydrolase [Bacillota bacterium]|nr:NUDIX hydrolase [Bacillota bacterium]
MLQRYNFCPQCGGRLLYRAIDDRQRLKCDSCQFILYENPIVGVAGILLQEGKILLGRRKQGYAGKWCIPCGYVEWDEPLEQALIREFREETGLEVVPHQLFAAKSNFHDPNSHTVGIWYMVKVIGGTLQAGDDLDQVGFFSLDQEPELAFPTDREVIRMLRAIEANILK